ncbi:MAG TPA: type II secretion system F family protein [Pirellulaceae bacterium]|nr:type II secretion system F family protein [Pirellulaceae bacterium]HMO92692.1 type II secretion system F family protein [Pirellulaceae bacterium]HMP70387.1 type II secretion system F family protein [Pirellulaceae bacterium]
MPEFTYTARDISGNKINGQMTAAHEREVIQHLGSQRLFPIEVKGKQEQKSFSISRGVGAQQMAAFYSQLASLLKNGVPLMRSLKLISQQSSAPQLKAALEDVSARVEDGEAIGDAFARHPKIFNSIAVNMARAGAEGGFLEDALERVSEFTEQQADLKARTVGALIYPIILSVIGTIIVSVLLIFFVPRFGELFDSLRARGSLPWATEALLGFSHGLKSNWLIILLFFSALFFGIRVYKNTENGGRVFDLIKIKIPLFGGINQNLAVARFCRVLGTMLKNGVPILKALEISSRATANRVLSAAIDNAADSITTGQTLSGPLSKSGYFPATVTEMISVAEESNTLDTVLVNIADGLEKRTSRRLDLIVRMLEPIMLMVMAAIILFIVIALLMPIMNMSQAIS